ARHQGVVHARLLVRMNDAHDAHAANVLGALSLVVTDEVRRAVTAAGDQAESDATVLSALEHFLDAPRVDQVAGVLGLTSSGTVRLVDRLERAGLVKRGAGDDARATTVTLTAAGRRHARRVTNARRDVLDGALTSLTATEREQLARLMGKVMGSVVR